MIPTTALPVLAHVPRLALVLLVVALLGLQASANTIILEGDDGRIQFGDSASAPSVERVPNPDAGAADQLVVRGEGGLVVEGAITASLLDLNTTGGSLVAREITVDTLIVNGAAPAAPAANCTDRINPTIVLATAAIQQSDSTPTTGIAGVPEWLSNWQLVSARTYDPDGVFSFSGSQQITLGKSGTYRIALENFVPIAKDSRYAEVRTAFNGVQMSSLGTTHCHLHSQEGLSTSCLVYFEKGTVLGVFVFKGGAGTGASFSGNGYAHPSWTTSLQYS